jgi:hypothetical protein
MRAMKGILWNIPISPHGIWMAVVVPILIGESSLVSPGCAGEMCTCDPFSIDFPVPWIPIDFHRFPVEILNLFQAAIEFPNVPRIFNRILRNSK